MARKQRRRYVRDAGIWGLPEVKYVDQADSGSLAAEGRLNYASRLLSLGRDVDGLRRLLDQAREGGDYFEAVSISRELVELAGKDLGLLDASWHREMGERLLEQGKPSLALQAFEAAGEAGGMEKARAALARLLNGARKGEPPPPASGEGGVNQDPAGR